MLMNKGVSKSAIAKIMGVSRTAFYHFIRTRELGPQPNKSQKYA